MDREMQDRARGCAVGAAVGDALGMPLEFGPRQPPDHLVREMRARRLPAGTFTDDTEMALALAESLLARCPLDPVDLAQRFVAWYRAGPDDVGNHTRAVLSRLAAGEVWEQAAEAAAVALEVVEMPELLRAVIEAAPGQSREALKNSGWVRHTLESAVWGLLTTDSFEEAVVQVVNLGNDADTAGAVVGALVGALAGAAYGLEGIPVRWWEAVRGEWPLRSETRWSVVELAGLADRLVGVS